MPSSSWRSIDPVATRIHLQRHQETIPINCSSITIDPTLIRHSLSRPIQPVIHKLCEGMSTFGWTRKCQSISRNSGEMHNCFLDQVVGINRYVVIECIDHEKKALPKNLRAVLQSEFLRAVIWRSKAIVHFLKVLPVFLCGVHLLHDKPGFMLQKNIFMGS